MTTKTEFGWLTYGADYHGRAWVEAVDWTPTEGERELHVSVATDTATFTPDEARAFAFAVIEAARLVERASRQAVASTR